MISNFYKQDITIERKTKGQDEYGVPSEGWSVLMTIKGLIDKKTGDERMAGGKETTFNYYKLYCDANGIIEEDRAVLDGNIYEILSVRNPLNLDHHLEADLRLVE